MVKNNKIVLAGLVLFFGVVLTLSFVFAAHVITTSTGGTSYSVDEDVSNLYNITVNNTDTTETANITQVDITIPNTFSFLTNSNGTDAGTHTFTNTSTILSWSNDGLVMNLTWKYFWFNATASTPGSYNLTITTTNATGTETTNISVTINDTTAPTISIISPTNTTYNNRTQLVNISTSGATNVWYNWNGTNATYTTPTYVTFAEGSNTLNAYANDSVGNLNSTSVIFTTDTTAVPVITLIAPADSTSSTTNAYNFTFNVTDDQTIANCSLIFDGSIINTSTSVNNTGGTNGIYNSSLSVATHTWSVNCTDTFGNVGSSSTRTLIVSSASTTPASSSSGGGGYSISRPTTEELNNGYQNIMRNGWRISFKLNGEYHNFKVEDIAETSAKISISSETQEAILLVGEEKKFEISGDNYYDVLVKLNSIDSTNKIYPKANFTIQSINEEIISPQQESEMGETVQANLENEIGGEETKEDETTNLTGLWIVIAIIIIIILSGVGYKKFKK